MAKKETMQGALEKFFSGNDAPGGVKSAGNADNAHITHNDTKESNALKPHRTASERVNIFLTPEQFAYVRNMSAIRGESMTTYIANLIGADMEKTGPLYDQVKDLVNQIQNR